MIVLSRHWNWCRWCQSSTTSTKLNRNMEQSCHMSTHILTISFEFCWQVGTTTSISLWYSYSQHSWFLSSSSSSSSLSSSSSSSSLSSSSSSWSPLSWVLDIIRICICLVNREVEDFRRTFVEARLWVANSLQLCYQASCATRPKKSCDVQARGSRETTWNCQIFIASAGVMITCRKASWWIEYELHHMILIYFAKSSRDAIEIVFTSTLNCR